MTPAPRDHITRFIKSRGRPALEDAVAELLPKDGAGFLTDEQLAEATALIVRKEREQRRRLARISKSWRNAA